MRLRSVLAWGVLSIGGVAVACGSDDDSVSSAGGSAGQTAGRGGSGTGGTKSTGGSAGSSGTKSSGGTAGSSGTKSSGGSSGTESSGGTTSAGGTTTGGTTSAGGAGGSSTAGRGGAMSPGGSMSLGGAGEGGAGEGGEGGVAAAGNGGGSSPQAGASGENAGGEGGAANGGGGRVKEPLSGLIDMQIISWHNTDSGVPSFKIDDLTPFPGLFGGIVINAAWNQLQPTESGPLDFSSIDDALAEVRTYNANNPTTPIGVKLRVYAGDTAPDWAKAIDDGPVAIFRNSAGCSTAPDTLCPINVGKFWAPEFITAWRALQAALAARYDDEPLIRQVAVTSCAAQTDEPFVGTEDQGDDQDGYARPNLIDAGYTDALEQACLSGAIDDYAAWKHTLIDYTFNPFNNMQGGSNPTQAAANLAFTISVMEDCRTRLGSRCVLDNHALAWPDDPRLEPIYDEMRDTLHGPVNFQTQAPSPMKCQWKETIALGVSYGANAIEVWPATNVGFLHLNAAEVGQLASEFTTPIAVPTGDPTTDCSDVASDFN